ncbi:hypothetical protein EHQ58_06205 [Leptospira ognonensis]|uniref:Uncharacterized protein n=1 Tax=Leptospira ognonensis TaxID=2484945 RepID=A0A4R9K267_9LEPT|nr:hypothetical protein [Leptospira ognonensis]TGL60089.1 hypothetical protein EHQ58_06205 [Leptospira ognonensis]
MKNIFWVLVLFMVSFLSTSISAEEYACGRIKDVWPPALPKATGTTCKTGVQAATPQEAFVLCTTSPTDGKNCCENNVVHKNIKGIAVVKDNQVTHFACP